VGIIVPLVDGFYYLSSLTDFKVHFIKILEMKKFRTGLAILFCITLILVSCKEKPVTTETALQAYLKTPDPSFKFEVRDSLKSDGISFYRIIFTSQKWRGIEWKHELTLLVPDSTRYDDALLFITGGSLKNGEPNTHEFTEELTQSLSHVASTNRAVVAMLWQVPNQPLYDDLTEDALISYTLHNYQNDHDFTWPLLFPMTKSAVRAMDVVQKFAGSGLKRNVSHFIVSGASKRGWTTWLTGANDTRVKAIGPMVIDVLNMPVNIDYQKKVWGDYSVEIQDYVNLGIAQQLGTPGGSDLATMVDPYSYRKTLTMPKMLFMGTNDPYWPVDAVKNYIDSIPGDNHICYTPNAAHDLGDKVKALTTLSAFLGTTVTGGKYPVCKYVISEAGNKIILKVESTPELCVNAVLWRSASTDQDFRNETWSDSTLNPVDKTDILVEINKPSSGYKAFYIDLVYKAPFGNDYTQSTRMFVTDSLNLLVKKSK
jgi:PhoPQ-activated pathogenicity-related protein